jgi:hypothetical protein
VALRIVERDPLIGCDPGGSARVRQTVSARTATHAHRLTAIDTKVRIAETPMAPALRDMVRGSLPASPGRPPRPERTGKSNGGMGLGA